MSLRLPIRGYEGYYEVDGDGDIWRVGALKPLIHGRSGKYAAVTLSKRGAKRRHYVHRLVAAAFIGVMEVGRTGNSWQVNHRDGDKNNNRAANLEYVTLQDNHDHAARTGLTARGSRIVQSKLTADDVQIIRGSNESHSAIARRFLVSRSAVRLIRIGINWKHLLPIAAEASA